MKIYLDDTRKLPKSYETEGDWIIIRSGEDLIALIGAEGLSNIELISFDNDLGEGRLEGYKVLDYIEELVLDKGEKCPEILIHSANPAAAQRMRQVCARLSQ